MVTSILLCATLLAAPGKESAASTPARENKRAVISFDEATIEAELQKPSGAVFSLRKKTRFQRSIMTPRNFVFESISSTEEL